MELTIKKIFLRMEKIHPEMMDTIKLICFINEKSTKNPTKTNIYRKDIINDLLNGLSCPDILLKHGLKSKEPSNYINKLLSRFSSYAGIKKPVSIRTFRKYGEKLLTSYKI